MDAHRQGPPAGPAIALRLEIERASVKLREAHRRVIEADDYLARPDANHALGRAYLGRALDRRRAALAHLRALRIRARAQSEGGA